MISVVIPVFNERESLAKLHQEIVQASQNHAFEFEVIFVDDGSTDDSWAIVRELAHVYPNVHGLRFRRNFGKAAALAAGFSASQGSIVLTLDADLQDDPAEIPYFLESLKSFDVVSGWKKTRHDPWHKVYPSWVFNFLVSWLTGVSLHDHNCGMKGYRSEVVRELRLYGELHRFIPVLAASRGFRIGEVVIHHRARPFGTSKYGWKRFLKGFFDLISVRLTTRYRNRPLHFFGSIACVAMVASLLPLVPIPLGWLLGVTTPSAISVFDALCLGCSGLLLFVGTQMLAVGLVAEVLVAHTVKPDDGYAIVEKI